MDMTTLEGNKLIAEFMGAKYHEAWSNEIYHAPHPTFDFGEPDNYPTPNSSRHWSPEGLQYHTSWDWLMPVVEKIRGLGFNFSIVSSKTDWSVYIIGDDGNMNFPYYSKLIDAVYASVVQFIQWYNQNSK